MKRVLKELLSTGLYLLIVLIFTYLMITYVVQRTVVDGGSMESTLQDEDQLLVDKISYRFKEPERFDIIVFPYKYAEDTRYIKRIIGMPGETIRIGEDGTIYIDSGSGEVELKESYGRQIIKDPGRAKEPITLGPDEYFVMGDNRNASSDSREFDVGNIKRGDIIGKAWVRIWPFEGFGTLD
ncbi:MAG: signal peptidase I [Lachnospiraceae bacterium]|nr:signal peptidase I [Lachnospiraceae bacterium]